MQNQYTQIDLSNYYKQWDREVFLGQQVKFDFKTDAGQNLSLIYRIFNHELAIQWIKDLSSDLSNKPFKENVEHKDDKKISIGFENPQRNICTATGTRCFDSKSYDASLLYMECSVLNDVTNAYKSAGSVKTTTNVTLDLPQSGCKTDIHDQDLSKTTINYNKRYQDRNLLEDLTPQEYSHLNKGIVILGVLEFFEMDDVRFSSSDEFPFPGDCKGMTLKGIQIGVYGPKS